MRVAVVWAMAIPLRLRISSYSMRVSFATSSPEPIPGSGELVANDTRMLYEDIRSRNGIAIAHTTATRMGTSWGDNDPALEPVVEIYQGARTNYESLEAPLVAQAPKDQPHMNQAGY